MAYQTPFGPEGPQPTPPAILRARFLSLVAKARPGYTATLPASLIEDIASTSVGALTIIDQDAVDLVNSLTPLGSNPFLLNQLGVLFGIPLGGQTNTSVNLVFTGTPGFSLGKGFTVSDGAFQYALVDGGVIGSSGQSSPLFAVATQAGIWAVPAGTVTQIITAVPSGYSVTVVNPQPGIPGTNEQTEESYRQQVITASLVAAQGYYKMLQTLLGKVSGVQKRLINAIPQLGGGWEVIVGGGDPFEVAYAIYRATQDISTLVGSTINVTGITNANPGIVSTDITHGYSVGQVFEIESSDPSAYNDTYVALSIPTPTSFALGKAFAGNQLTALSWSNTSGGQISATTTTPHGVTVGSTFVLTGCLPAGYNGTYIALAGTTGSTLVAALVSDPGSQTQLGQLVAGIANVNTTSTSPWISGGIVTPNFRNVTPSIIDYPNTYGIPFAVPPPQTVTMTVTWNTSSQNFVSDAAVEQLSSPALAAYINAVFQGQPLNLFDMQDVFRESVAGILSPSLITRLVFAVSIDGVGVSPDMGTGIIEGDPQSFFIAASTGINVVQG